MQILFHYTGILKQSLNLYCVYVKSLEQMVKCAVLCATVCLIYFSILSLMMIINAAEIVLLW